MKSAVSRVTAFMSVPSGNPSLLKEQYRAFARQLPMMYFILMTSTWAVAATHMATAPLWLTIGLPLLFTAASLARILHWWRSRNVEPTAEAALRALRRTNRLAFIIAAVFTGWSYMLFPYGDAYAQSHLAFYMSITVISCIFCLMFLRSAAVTVTAIVNGTFIPFYALTGQPTFIAIAVNIALVSVGMLVILMVNYRNFAEMVDAQTRTEALSNENLRLANLDSLTGLPNRRAFFAHLQSVWTAADTTRSRVAVGVLDLDGFKPVNDIYGHSTGDKLLIEVGGRLANLGTDGTRFFRLGGDEFAFVTTDLCETDVLVSFGADICRALQEPFALPAATVQISASVGAAVHPDSASSPEMLFDHADYALYHGKRTRRGTCTLFSNAMDAQIRREALIEQVLKQTDMDEELTVVFQPIVDSSSGRTIGFEALARWESPVLGRVPPGEFVPVAERGGFVGRLTRTLLRKAVTAAERWPAGMRLSFNLSAHDLNTEESVLAIAAILGRSSFDSHRIDFEITETAFAHDFEQVRKSVEALRVMGCGISLDDFGTGYSSLTRLHALPLTKIKIDRSFVKDLHKNPASYKIVKSLLALSRDMHLDCVIEGVETQEEMDALAALGAVLIQGYFYSPPVAGHELGDYLDAAGTATPQLG